MANQVDANQLEMEREAAIGKILKFSDNTRTGNLPMDVRLRVITLSAQHIANIDRRLLSADEVPNRRRGLLGRIFSDK